MAQYIKQGNIFGRIGSGIGKGLAEQLPEEINHGRLAAGLKNFEQDHQNLNPMQQLARISSIKGITPQMIQSFSELARINNQGNSFKNLSGQGQAGVPQDGRSSPDLSEVKQANLLDQAANARMPAQQRFNPTAQGKQEAIGNNSELTHQNPEVLGSNQLENYNSGDPRGITRLPWTPEQRNSRISHYINEGFLPAQAQDLAADDEERYLAVPSAVQKQQKEKKERGKEAEDVFTKQLETRLQKTNEGVYKDITGDMLADLKRAMSRAVIENPNASVEDIAEDFSKRALRLAKTKKEVEGLGETTGWESIFTGDKVLTKLNAYQKIFEDAGNQLEYFNILKSQFGLSPQGAAVIAYPPKAGTKKYISSYKPNSTIESAYATVPDAGKMESSAKKAALDVSKVLDDNDSILAIARLLSEKDPYFDQRTFFKELSNNPSIRLNSRQIDETGKGEKDWFPTWGDVKIFPALKR